MMHTPRMHPNVCLPHKSVVGAITAYGRPLRTWCSSQTVQNGHSNSNAFSEPSFQMIYAT